MQSDLDGPPDWIFQLDGSSTPSNDAVPEPALHALDAAAERRAAHPLDQQAIDALQTAILAAVRAGIGDSQIAATGRISVDAVRRICRATQ